MNDPISSCFLPILGLPCWGVDRVQGSMISFEFGSPYLVTREPYTSRSTSLFVRERMARRSVKAVGAWNMFVFSCSWSITADGSVLATDQATDQEIQAALRAVNGQKIIGLALDPSPRLTTFRFDLVGVLTCWPYESSEEEQWSLTLPDGRELSYRADGFYSLGPTDLDPSKASWQPLPGQAIEIGIRPVS